MNNLKISTRLTVLIGLMSVLSLLIGGLGLYGLAQTKEGLRTVYEDRTVPIAQLQIVERDILYNRHAINSAVAVGDPARFVAIVEQMRHNIAEVDATWQAYAATQMTPEEKALADGFVQARQTFVDAFLRPAQEALQANDLERARQLIAEQEERTYGGVRDNLSKLIELQVNVAKQEYDQAADRFNSIRTLTVSAIVLGVTLAGLFGWSIVRGIGRSLQQAVAATDAVAQGDLTQTIRADGQDEVAQLLRSLAAMQGSLVRVVSTVRQGSESVAAASTQIAQGNQDLSGRTENQASALEETAASMEELGSTVRQNADNAKQANQLAQGASTVAQQGGEVVAQVVTPCAASANPASALPTSSASSTALLSRPTSLH